MRRGHGRRRTQLEIQRAMDAYRNPQQPIRNIDREVYLEVLYHPGLSEIKGTLKKVFVYLLHFKSHEHGVLQLSSCFVLPAKKSFLTIM